MVTVTHPPLHIISLNLTTLVYCCTVLRQYDWVFRYRPPATKRLCQSMVLYNVCIWKCCVRNVPKFGLCLSVKQLTVWIRIDLRLDSGILWLQRPYHMPTSTPQYSVDTEVNRIHTTLQRYATVIKIHGKFIANITLHFT